MSDVSSEIARRNQPQGSQPPAGQSTIGALVQAMAPEFQKALPTTFPVEHFMRLALTEMRANPKLLDCSQASLLGSLMLAARLGLEPGGPLGQLWLTTRDVTDRASGEKVATVVPIIGYQGLRDLALRSGLVLSVQSILVREGDQFSRGANIERGIWFDWFPADVEEEETHPWRGVLTVAKLAGGGTVWRYLTKQQVYKRRDSGGGTKGFGWRDWEEAMVLKTGIRALSSDLPKSTKFAEALRADETPQVWTPGQPPEPRPLESAEQVEERAQQRTLAEMQPEPKRPARQRRQQEKPAEPEPEQERYAPPPEGAPPMPDYGEEGP